LEDLARQVGVAAHAVRLTADLQRARERLVTSREEERRRIRRALYEELEPGLVGLDGHFASLRALIPDAPAAAHELVPPLRRDLRTAIADIRRLVQDLRPPALDELGLVGAIREIAAQMSTGGRLTGTGADPYAPQIVIDAPLDLPLLSAAVEVAAYRIVQAALTSIVQQTQARTCVVRLSITDALYIEVMGDGGSFRANDDDELGLRVIHERAEELGGTCVIETVAAGGTHLQARLPLLKG
jgi:signal transduction histidine kinase